MQLNAKQRLSAAEVTARSKNFNDMLRHANTVKIDKRGMNGKLDPSIVIEMHDGSEVLISANPDGKTIQWGYEDEAQGGAP